MLIFENNFFLCSNDGDGMRIVKKYMMLNEMKHPYCDESLSMIDG